MPDVIVLVMAVLCCLGREVSSLGGLLVSVQSKFTELDEPKSISWKHSCSGTLMNIRSALTCASCVVYSDDRLGLQTVDSEDLRLYGGSKCPDHTDKDPGGQVVYVSAVQVHPEYVSNEIDKTPNEFNFAILVTEKPFMIGGSIKVLPLYSEDVDDVRRVLMANGTECFTMTWYFYMNGKPVNENPEFGEISVALDNIDSCSNLSSVLESVAIVRDGDSPYSCAKGLKGMPICRVDTGSPIVCEGKLLALIINERLDCDNDEEHVVISGINNALAFLKDPDLYSSLTGKHAPKVTSTTVVERGRSSQAHLLPGMAALVFAVSVLICSIKGIFDAV